MFINGKLLQGCFNFNSLSWHHIIWFLAKYYYLHVLFCIILPSPGLTVGPASGTRSHDYGPIEISSDYDDSDNSVDEDDEDDSINTDYDPGIDGEYYGGGTCHICGKSLAPFYNFINGNHLNDLKVINEKCTQKN